MVFALAQLLAAEPALPRPGVFVHVALEAGVRSEAAAANRTPIGAVRVVGHGERALQQLDEFPNAEA